MPLISIIVPIYNVEKYLHRCIDSVLAQTFTDFELILVNDGSPDNCGKICDEYAERDSRIVVVHKENGGLSDARNAGIDWCFNNSNSRWLSFIDSDDWVHPQFLEYLYKAAIDNAVKLSICNANRTEEFTVSFPKAPFTSQKLDAMKFYIENEAWATVAWNKLYAKELFLCYRYPKGIIHEDEFITYRLLYDVKNIAWIEQPLYEYYQRANSIMSDTYSIDHLIGIEAYKEQAKFFETRNRDVYLYKLNGLIELLFNTIENLQLSPSEQKIKENLIKDYRKYFRRHRKKLNITTNTHWHYYVMAFPKRMHIYYLMKVAIFRLKENGIAYIFKKAIEKIKRKK